jgi:hypothetical protein
VSGAVAHGDQQYDSAGTDRCREEAGPRSTRNSRAHSSVSYCPAKPGRSVVDRSWSPKAAERNQGRLAKPAEIKAQCYGQCDMSGAKLIVQPDHGEKPVMDFLNSAHKTVTLKQFTFTHPLLLDTVMALHKKGVRVRVMLNGAKATGERLNDPFFEKMKSTGIEVQWSNPSFLVTHEKSIIVDGKSALLPTFNFMEKYCHSRLRGLDQRSGPGRADPEVLRLRLEARTISSARRCRTRVEPGICPSIRLQVDRSRAQNT